MSVKHTNLKKPRLPYLLGLAKRPFQMSCDYHGDGLGTKGKSTGFMEDARFLAAWNENAESIAQATGEEVPDIRWRAHIALWAARQGLQREGDFVECGVHSGILSGFICRALDWNTLDRRFWLFDTWAGIPKEGLTDAELTVADGYNRNYHKRDIYTAVERAFSAYPSCRLVRGALPKTLGQAQLTKIAYLSIDLNSATYEKQCIELLWPLLSPGAIVVLDDYNFSNCELQREMWNEFAREKNLSVAALPTGQGLLIKP